MSNYTQNDVELVVGEGAYYQVKSDRIPKSSNRRMWLLRWCQRQACVSAACRGVHLDDAVVVGRNAAKAAVARLLSERLITSRDELVGILKE